MQKLKIAVAATSAVLLSCGGGGSSTPETTSADIGGSSTQLAYNACESTYYREIIGTYKGVVDYRFTDPNDNVLKQHCSFEVELKISGVPRILPIPGTSTLTATQCDLTASYSGSVDQEIFQSPDTPFFYQCVVSQGSLFITDPNNNVVDPETFYENIIYPVSMGIAGDFGQPSDGPYQSNPDISVPYINFIGSNSALITSIRFEGEGDGKIVSSRDGEFGNEIDSLLIKER